MKAPASFFLLVIALLIGTLRAPAQGPRFEIIPPVKDADPTIRHQETIQLPTKLYAGPLDAETKKVLSGDGQRGQKVDDYIKVALLKDSLMPVEITVGFKMIVGVRTEEFIYPEDAPHPEKPNSFGYCGVENLCGGTGFLHRGGPSVPGRTYKYVVEKVIEVFETNVPPQHMWMPEGKTFKVLYTRTLKETVTVDFPLSLP